MGVTNEYIAECASQKKCFACGEKFSEKNVFTQEGARETLISGMCEICWENLFDEGEEEGE